MNPPPLRRRDLVANVSWIPQALVDLATANVTYRRKPYRQLAEDLHLTINGYNRRIARRKPFLFAKAKTEATMVPRTTELDSGRLAEGGFHGRVLYLCRRSTWECLGDQKA